MDAFLWTASYHWVSVSSKVKPSLTPFSTPGVCIIPCSYLDFPVPRKLQVYSDFTLLSLYLDRTFCSGSPTSPLASDGIPKDSLLNNKGDVAYS